MGTPSTLHQLFTRQFGEGKDVIHINEAALGRLQRNLEMATLASDITGPASEIGVWSS
jgi:hypothetical protein